MGRVMIDYESREKGARYGREELFILIHYAHQIDEAQASKLYYASENEYIYRVDKRIPLNGLDFYESNQPYWETSVIQEVVNFMESTLIPALENDASSNQDLIDILGGWDTLKEKIGKGASYKRKFRLVWNENKIKKYTTTYPNISDKLRLVMLDSLMINQPLYIG